MLWRDKVDRKVLRHDYTQFSSSSVQPSQAARSEMLARSISFPLSPQPHPPTLCLALEIDPKAWASTLLDPE